MKTNQNRNIYLEIIIFIMKQNAAVFFECFIHFGALRWFVVCGMWLGLDINTKCVPIPPFLDGES